MNHNRFREEFEDEFAKLGSAPAWVMAWSRGDPGPWDEYTSVGAGNGAARLEEGRTIDDGERDTKLASLAGTMRERGFSEAAIFAALDIENRDRCNPPLGEAQIRKIARSIARYPPNPYADVTIVLPANGRNGIPSENGKPPSFAFPSPVPASQLRQQDLNTAWLWRGYLSKGSLTLFSALWKAGKTTLLANLLKAFSTTGGGFCGQIVLPSRVLYVTEESEGRWAGRVEALGLRDNIEFMVRPFKSRPDWPTWEAFCKHLAGLITHRPFDLLVIDALSNIWPVRDENDAPQVQSALMPLQTAVGEQCAGCLVHHNRKSDGDEATAPRGSGAMMAFVDTILELRRYAPKEPKDRRRVLRGYGRYDETPEEVVVELTEEGGYQVHGTKSETGEKDILSTLIKILPHSPPGWTVKEIEQQWPSDHSPRHQRLLDTLHHGSDSCVWRCEGEGTRGNPYRYFKPG